MRALAAGLLLLQLGAAAWAEDVSSSSSIGGVSPSGTFTAGDLVCGAGGSTIQDCTNYTGPAVAPKGITFTNNSVIATSTAAVTSPLYWSGTLSGTCSGSPGCFANSLIISNDSLTSTALNGSGNFQVQTTINNATNTGGNVNFQSYLIVPGSTANAANQFFVSANIWGAVTASQGGSGTGASARGSFIAMNPQQTCLGTATFLTECSGSETNVSLGTTASANLFFGQKVILTSQNVTAATSDSGGFVVGIGAGGTNTLACGYCFGQNGSDHGVAATGALIAASKTGGSAVALGLDFDKMPAFTTSVIRGPSAGTMNITSGANQNFTVLDAANGAKFRVAGASAAVTGGLVVTPGTGATGGAALSIQGGGTGGVIINAPMTIGGATGATASTGEMAFTKIAAVGTAPGGGFLKMEAVTGTNAGTCKIIAYAGTSTTPVTIVDNVGGSC